MYIRVPEKGCWLILTSHLQGEGRETDTDEGPSMRAAVWTGTTGRHFTQSGGHTHTPGQTSGFEGFVAFFKSNMPQYPFCNLLTRTGTRLLGSHRTFLRTSPILPLYR